MDALGQPIRIADAADTRFAADESGASRPTRVMVARLRSMAVNGICSSSASQTDASVSSSVGIISRVNW